MLILISSKLKSGSAIFKDNPRRCPMKKRGHFSQGPKRECEKKEEEEAESSGRQRAARLRVISSLRLL